VRDQQRQQRVGGQVHQVAARVRQQQPPQDGLLEARQRGRAACVGPGGGRGRLSFTLAPSWRDSTPPPKVQAAAS